MTQSGAFNLGSGMHNELNNRIEALEREVKELRADIETFWKPQFDEQVERAETAEADKARLSEAWQALDNSISGAIKETDTPHRVLRDGRVIMDGEAAELYFNHLMLLRKMARAALSGSGSGRRVPDGWKLVPVELTQSMIIAYNEEFEKLSIEKWANALLTWPALLAASPAAPQQGGE